MTTSESVDKIFPAFIKAQAEIGNPKKTKENTFFKAKYAELSDIIDMSKQVLLENGLCLIQSPEGNGNSITVTGRIIHTSGQWIEGSISLTPTKNDPQQAGSAITYARRYQISAMLNIAQEDDDGNKASEPVKIQTMKPTDGKEITDAIKEAVALTSDINKYLSEGLYDHPENVKAVVAAGDIVKMRSAHKVGKDKSDAIAKENAGAGK